MKWNPKRTQWVCRLVSRFQQGTGREPVGLIQDLSLPQGPGDHMIIRILPPIQLVEGVDENVRRYAEFGKAPPDTSGLPPPTAIAAEGLALQDQEIYVRLLVRLIRSPNPSYDTVS